MNSFQNMVNFFLLLSTVILTVIAVVWVRVIFSGFSKPHGTQQNSLFIFCLQSFCHIDYSGKLGTIFLECCITCCIIFFGLHNIYWNKASLKMYPISIILTSVCTIQSRTWVRDKNMLLAKVLVV